MFFNSGFEVLDLIGGYDELDRWCATIAGLTKHSEGMWVHRGGESVISYPEAGLSGLLDIEPHSYWFRHRNDVVTEVVRQHPPNGPIFDVGGGNGFVSLGLNEAGFDSIVVEPDVNGASNATKRGLPVVRAAFQDLELPDGSVPAAGMFDVLEHIEDDLGALVRLNRALKPDGALYIAVPAYNMLWSKEDEYGGHFRRYTVDGLKILLERAGFSVEYGSYFFTALLPAIFLFRTIPGRLGLTRDDNSNQTEREHELPRNAFGSILLKSFKRELRTIRAGNSLPVGASCIVAARKPPAS